jgi:hypothetical protein
MIELLKYLGISAIPQALFLIVVGFWGKKLAENFLANEIEIKKIELQNELEKSKIQFSNLHSKRIEIFENIYNKLTELNAAMIDLTRRIHPVVEDAEKEHEGRILRANKALFDFRDFFFPNKIYFDKALAEKIENVHKMYWDKGWDFYYLNSRLRSGEVLREKWKEFYDESKKITQSINADIPPILTELEEDFREILGVYERKMDSSKIRKKTCLNN